MIGETVWLLLLGLAAILPFVKWARRGGRRNRPPAGSGGAAPDEPCWTEQISTDGRLSYGRYGCYHSELAEMDARARSGEFASG